MVFIEMRWYIRKYDINNNEYIVNPHEMAIAAPNKPQVLIKNQDNNNWIEIGNSCNIGIVPAFPDP